MVESSFDVQPSALATNTTNLININISNSGNITAVATGENHQINKCYTAIAPSAQLRIQQNNQTRTAQYASLPLSTNHCADSQRPTISTNLNQIESFGPDLNAISTIATTSAETNTDALSCNFKNCTISSTLTKPKTRNEVVFQTPQHIRMKKNGEASLALVRNQPILPPPLFDESSSMSTATLPLLPNDSVRQMKSRRHHRTIPRHFTLSDTANISQNTNSLTAKPKAYDDSSKVGLNCSGTATLNKKSVCQCPVQHVPMTYMGSAYLNLTRNQQTNELLLSTLTKKWPSQKSHVAKSASFTSAPTATASNITTSSTAIGYNRNSASGLLSAANPSKPGPTSPASDANAPNPPKTTPKIATISKQIGQNDVITHSQVQQKCNDPADGKSMQELLPINISSTKPNQTHAAKIGDSTNLLPNSNPVLPPKLSKTPVYTNRPAECAPAMAKPKAASNSLTMTTNQNRPNVFGRERSKSPAVDKTYSMATPLNIGTDQKMNHIKTTYPTTANLTIASNNFTLPKPSNKAPMSVKNQTNSPKSNVATSSTGTNTKVVCASKMKKTPHNEIIMKHELNENIHLINADRLRKDKLIDNDKSLPVCTTFTNCSNPKEHFLPNDTSLDDDYLSECENCKSAHGSRYYLDEQHVEQPQETMTLQRKIDEKECDEQPYYRTSSTLPTNTKQKTT